MLALISLTEEQEFSDRFLDTKKSNAFLYIEKLKASNSFSMNYVPLDDSIVADHILPRSKDCRQLIELMLENNKNLSTLE